jgi:hypothetical protein
MTQLPHQTVAKILMIGQKCQNLLPLRLLKSHSSQTLMRRRRERVKMMMLNDKKQKLTNCMLVLCVK